MPVSAQTADNTDRLLTVTVSLLDEGEATYDEDMITDQSMRTLAAELVREKILQQTYEGDPAFGRGGDRSLWRPKKLIKIGAVVLVEKESQKGILDRQAR